MAKGMRAQIRTIRPNAIERNFIFLANPFYRYESIFSDRLTKMGYYGMGNNNALSATIAQFPAGEQSKNRY
jgi:hypothetical protein